jgi:uncharacterized SAM-binding protein YcdF (DUF218 family)
MNSLFFILYKVIGGAVTPPGCFFTLFFPLLLGGILKTRERAARKFFLYALFLLALLYALFMPVTAEFLSAGLETKRPPLPHGGTATLVAVLAGGGTHSIPGREGEIELSEQSYQRLAEGAALARLQNWPLLYAGAYDQGDVPAYAASVRRQAAFWGFEGEVILESSSRTTWENMREIAKIAQKRGIQRVVFSTTAYHMRRALWMAERHMPSVELVPWPSGWRSARKDKRIPSDFAPSARAFLDSCAALREWVGLTVYKFLY